MRSSNDGLVDYSAFCNPHSAFKWRSRWDLRPHSSRRQQVAFLFSYGSDEMEN